MGKTVTEKRKTERSQHTERTNHTQTHGAQSEKERGVPSALLQSDYLTVFLCDLMQRRPRPSQVFDFVLVPIEHALREVDAADVGRRRLCLTVADRGMVRLRRSLHLVLLLLLLLLILLLVLLLVVLLISRSRSGADLRVLLVVVMRTGKREIDVGRAGRRTTFAIPFRNRELLRRLAESHLMIGNVRRSHRIA